MEDKVYVVTVTYGNRFHSLKQVIDAALSEGVYKIIVVDNNSVPESRKKLEEYEKMLGEKVKVLYFDENYGSAGGFKRGLEIAYNDPECDFIWLLDDDNKPLPNSLKNLINFFYSLKIENKEEKIALLSYRKNQISIYQIEEIIKQPKLILKVENSFLNFHVKKIHNKVFRYLRRNIVKEGNLNIDQKTVKLTTATYGGLFVHKNILKKIGFPNEDFYLYVDDTEWTYRITKNGGSIYLVLDSIVEDLEPSWDKDAQKKSGIYSISKGEPHRIYYIVRNSVFFEVNNFVRKKWIYFLNIMVYLFLTLLFGNRNLKIIIKAIKDGYKGRLGKLDL